jgi:hypothetical protein
MSKMGALAVCMADDLCKVSHASKTAGCISNLTSGGALTAVGPTLL